MVRWIRPTAWGRSSWSFSLQVMGLVQIANLPEAPVSSREEDLPPCSVARMIAAWGGGGHGMGAKGYAPFPLPCGPDP